jgi:hypothetical protein
VSVISGASLSAMPIAFSNAASTITPPSEVMRLPSRAGSREGHLMSDHVHMMISIPPKYAVSQVVGLIKGKSAIHLARSSVSDQLPPG